MDGILAAIPQLVKVVQEAGVVGLLVIIAVILGWEVLRLRKTLVVTFRQRDGARLAYVLYKQACDQAKIVVDSSVLKEFLDEKGELA